MDKILIVDDEPDILKMLLCILEDEGYDVLSAISAEETLNLLSEETVDLILLDIMMPDMDGFELGKILKSDVKTANIPIIFMTALDRITDKVKGFDIGAVDYITKPLAPDEVTTRVRTHLKIKSTEEALQNKNRQLSKTLEKLADANRQMVNEGQNLEQIIKLGAEVAQVKDLDILLEKILSSARRFVNADAGSIYIKDKEKNELKFSYAQNDTMSKNLPPGQKLIYTTFSMPITNKSIAGYVANTGEMLNIPDVYHLTDAVPYSFDKSYDEISRYRSQSMLTVPLKNSEGEVVGVLQMINAKDEHGNVVPFSVEDEPLITHLANNAAIALERAQITRTIILRMIRMAELRDPKETGAHVNRVAAYAVEIYEAWGKKKGLPQKELDANRDILRMAAILHDVGKVAISDTILKKPGRFTDEEFEIMKRHSFLGARLFADPTSVFDEAAAEVALNHHEWWNGGGRGYPGYVDVMTGYPLPGYENEDRTPRKKMGEEIPAFGRVVAIADVYDALCSKRVYKEAWDESKALKIIREESGGQFDPEMVEAFFSCLNMIHSIRERYPDLTD